MALENVETFKVKNPVEGSFLFAWILLLLVFYLFYHFFPFSGLLFERGRKKGNGKGDDNIFGCGGGGAGYDALLSAGKEKHLQTFKFVRQFI